MLHSGAGLTPLVGRERDLGIIEARLANGARLITLFGPGGSGKTRLAREVFDRRQEEGLEAYFVDLVGIQDPGLVPTEIASTLGVAETAELDAAAALKVALHDRSALVVLDNLEELMGSRGFLADLLKAAPKIQMIATSRIPLGIPGEVEFQVPPLELPRGNALTEIVASPAGSLFLARARAVGRLDEVDGPTAIAIAELCRRLDGLPLALELAAARTRILPPAAILRHLADHTTGVLAKVGDGDSRHRSLDAVLSWSLDLLEPNEAEVLGAVAICPGGFDLAMAQALAPDRDVLRAIDVLATYGLLLARPEVAGEPWYQLLETIRAAALERAPGDIAVARWDRLSAHISQRVMGTLEAAFRLDDATFQRLDVILDDVRASLDWTEANNPALNLSIAVQFGLYWRNRGRSREAISRLRIAIEANPTPTSDLAQAFNNLAALERDLVDLPEALRVAAEAVRISRIVGDPENEVEGLANVVIFDSTAVPEELDRLRDLLPIVQHPVVRYVGMSALAWAEGLESGFSDQAFIHYRDAKDALLGSPYRGVQALADANLALIYLYGDRPVEAYEHSTQALASLGGAYPETLAWVHAVRTTAASASGRFSEAIASLRLAFEFAESGGMGRAAPEVLVAAVAVLAASDAPLLAAKMWGAMTASAFSANLPDPDRTLAERLLVPARRATDPISFELAMRAGQKVGVDHVIDEVLASLDRLTVLAVPGKAVHLLHGTLTTREIEVLALVGAGKSDAEIATALFISPKTASVHVSNAKSKLGVDSRLEAALKARDLGLVEGAADDD